MAQVDYVPDGPTLEAIQEGLVTDPLSVAMLLVGGVFVTVSVAVFGYLSLGGAVSLLLRSVREQRPQA